MKGCEEVSFASQFTRWQDKSVLHQDGGTFASRNAAACKQRYRTERFVCQHLKCLHALGCSRSVDWPATGLYPPCFLSAFLELNFKAGYKDKIPATSGAAHVSHPRQ